MNTEISNLLVRFGINASDYTRGIKQAQAQTAAFQKEAQSNFQRIGASFTASLTAPLMAMRTAAIGAFTSFDEAMTKSLAIMDVTSEQTAAMRKQALELGAASAAGPTKLAESYYYLASAGLNAEQSIAALPQVMKFSAAGALDLAQATELAVGSQAALGLKSKDAQQNLQNLTRVTDVIVRASKLAQGSTQDYATALSRDAAASMRSFNIELEEGMAVLTAYGEQNIKASLAGGMFGRSLRLLAQSARENAAQHQQLGFRVFDENTGKMRHMADIVENLETIMKGASAETRTYILSQLGFEALSQRAIMPLVGMSGSIRDFEKQLRSASGFSAKVAAKQMQSFANQMKVIKNSVTVAAIEVGQVLAPVILTAAGAIKTLVDRWRALTDETKRAVIGSGAVVALMATVGVVGPLLSSGLAMALGPLKMMGGAFASLGAIAKPVLVGLVSLLFTLANPLKLAASLLVGLQGGILFYFGPMMTVIKWAVSFAAAGLVVVERMGGINKALEAMKEAGIRAWEWSKPAREALVEVFTAVWSAAVKLTRFLGVTMLDWLEKVTANWKVDWQEVSDAIVTSLRFITMLFQNAGAIATAAWEAVKPAVADVTAWLKGQREELEANKDQWISVGKAIGIVAAVLVTLVTTYKALAMIMTLLHVKQVLGIALWVAYKAAVVLAWGALAVGVTLFKLLSFAVGALFGALTLVQVALTGIGLVAGAALGVVLVGAVMAAWKAVTSLASALRDNNFLAGPVAHIGGLFREWGSILREVFSLLREGNMQGAWRMLVAGAKLATEQLKALFPPLWQSIREGFSATMEYLGKVWNIELDRMIQQRKLRLAAMAGLGVSKKRLLEEEALIEKDARTAEQAARMMLDARLGQAGKGFKVPETEGIKEARKELEDLRAEIANEKALKPLMDYVNSIWRAIPGMGGIGGVQDPVQEKLNQLVQQAGDAGTDFGRGFTANAAKELGKFDAVLYGSAEAAARWADYLDKVAPNMGAKGKVGAPGVPRVAGVAGVADVRMPHDVKAGGGAAGKGDAVAGLEAQQLEVQKQLLDEMRKSNAKDGINIFGANL